MACRPGPGGNMINDAQLILSFPEPPGTMFDQSESSPRSPLTHQTSAWIQRNAVCRVSLFDVIIDQSVAIISFPGQLWVLILWIPDDVLSTGCQPVYDSSGEELVWMNCYVSTRNILIPISHLPTISIQIVFLQFSWAEGHTPECGLHSARFPGKD